MIILVTFGAGNGAAKADPKRIAGKVEYFMIVVAKRNYALASHLKAWAAKVKRTYNILYLAAKFKTVGHYLYLRSLEVSVKMLGVSLGQSSCRNLPSYRSFVTSHTHPSNIYSGSHNNNLYYSSVQRASETV